MKTMRLELTEDEALDIVLALADSIAHHEQLMHNPKIGDKVTDTLRDLTALKIKVRDLIRATDWH